LLTFVLSPHLAASLDYQFVPVETNVDLIAFESRELQTNDEFLRSLVRVTHRCPQSEPFLVLEVGTGQRGLE
jgi:hypothetical protein